jgi:hypothetical protein
MPSIGQWRFAKIKNSAEAELELSFLQFITFLVQVRGIGHSLYGAKPASGGVSCL